MPVPFVIVLSLVSAFIAACGGGGGASADDQGGLSAPAPAAPASAAPAPAANLTAPQLELVLGHDGGAGTLDGQGTQARFTLPKALGLDSAGQLLVAGYDMVRRVSPQGVVDTVAMKAAGGGPANVAVAEQLLRLPGGDVLVVAQGAIHRLKPDGLLQPVGKIGYAVGMGHLRFATDGAGQLHGLQHQPVASGYPLGPWSYRIVKIGFGPQGQAEATPVEGATSKIGDVIDMVADPGGRLHFFISRDGEPKVRIQRLGPAGQVEATALEIDLDAALPACVRRSAGYVRWMALDAQGNSYLQPSQCPKFEEQPYFRTSAFLRSRPDGRLERLSLPLGDGLQQEQAWLGQAAADAQGQVYVALAPSHAVYRVGPSGGASLWAGSPPVPDASSATRQIAAILPPSSSVSRIWDVAADPTGPSVYLTVIANLAGPPYERGKLMVELRDGKPVSHVLLRVPTDTGTALFDIKGQVMLDADGAFHAYGNRYSKSGGILPFDWPPRLTHGEVSYTPSQVLWMHDGWATASYYQELYRWKPGGSSANRFWAGGFGGAPRDGFRVDARLGQVRGMAAAPNGVVYFADQGDAPSEAFRRIRRLDADGWVTTLVNQPGLLGTPTQPDEKDLFGNIEDLAIDRAGNLYVADSGKHVIHKVTPAGAVSAFIGVPGRPGIRPGALPGAIDSPQGIDIDRDNVLYIATPNAVLRVRLPD